VDPVWTPPPHYANLKKNFNFNTASCRFQESVGFYLYPDLATMEYGFMYPVFNLCMHRKKIYVVQEEDEQSHGHHYELKTLSNIMSSDVNNKT
jgi:hypothetical protein